MHDYTIFFSKVTGSHRGAGCFDLVGKPQCFILSVSVSVSVTAQPQAAPLLACMARAAVTALRGHNWAAGVLVLNWPPLVCVVVESNGRRVSFLLDSWKDPGSLSHCVCGLYCIVPLKAVELISREMGEGEEWDLEWWSDGGVILKRQSWEIRLRETDKKKIRFAFVYSSPICQTNNAVTVLNDEILHAVNQPCLGDA